MINLKEIFFSLCRKHSSQNEIAEKMWNEIEMNYSAAGRYYHTLYHLEKMFENLEGAKKDISDFESVSWAVFYHDLFYDASRSDNEERSALAALKILNGLKIPFQKIMKVQSFILATKNHETEEEEDKDLEYFLDADLSVLGATEKGYFEYATNVRSEYSIYPDETYKPGRKKVLESFLAMPRIFKTDHFNALFEKQARENLKKECLSL
ncbi:MAG: hypothetical protein IAF38_14075 [Bacteroidia bacterium]|nr:hypothetical protein [Bacteroidia bacterium]